MIVYLSSLPLSVFPASHNATYVIALYFPLPVLISTCPVSKKFFKISFSIMYFTNSISPILSSTYRCIFLIHLSLKPPHWSYIRSYSAFSASFSKMFYFIQYCTLPSSFVAINIFHNSSAFSSFFLKQISSFFRICFAFEIHHSLFQCHWISARHFPSSFKEIP